MIYIITWIKLFPHFLSKKQQKSRCVRFIAIRRNVTFCHNNWLNVKCKGVMDTPCVYRLIVNPSKNGVLRSPTYHTKSCWKIRRVYPKKFSSNAFNLDLVVTVSQPHDDNVISLLLWTVAILWPCRYTLESPFESVVTCVLDLDQLSRREIAVVICDSILRIKERWWVN